MTSIVARTFEHLVHYRLMAVLDPAPPPPDPRFPPGHYRFADTQFGFRKSRRTTDAIHYLLTSIQTVIRRDDLSDPEKPRMICPVLFLDLQKAFDRVDHSILLQRLHDAGITGKAWLWIRSFLTGRRMRTVDANEHSEWMQVEYGVPQGCVLSPLLFIVFINDLAISIAHRCPLLSLIFYADDGAIGPNPHASSIDDKAYAARYRENLSTAVSVLDHWCDSSRMRFGPKKTQLVLYSTRQSTDPAVPLYNSFQLCGFTISIATHYRYLGVILEHKLQWGCSERPLCSRRSRPLSASPALPSAPSNPISRLSVPSCSATSSPSSTMASCSGCEPRQRHLAILPESHCSSTPRRSQPPHHHSPDECAAPVRHPVSTQPLRQG